MRDVDARIDDGQGTAGAGRLGAVGADRGAPPLLRKERVAGCVVVGPGAAQLPLEVDDRARHRQRWDDPLRGPARQAPDPEPA